jgi:hypothetical protein
VHLGGAGVGEADLHATGKQRVDQIVSAVQLRLSLTGPLRWRPVLSTRMLRRIGATWPAAEHRAHAAGETARVAQPAVGARSWLLPPSWAAVIQNS